MHICMVENRISTDSRHQIESQHSKHLLPRERNEIRVFGQFGVETSVSHGPNRKFRGEVHPGPTSLGAPMFGYSVQHLDNLVSGPLSLLLFLLLAWPAGPSRETACTATYASLFLFL